MTDKNQPKQAPKGVNKAVLDVDGGHVLLSEPTTPKVIPIDESVEEIVPPAVSTEDAGIEAFVPFEGFTVVIEGDAAQRAEHERALEANRKATDARRNQ